MGYSTKIGAISDFIILLFKKFYCKNIFLIFLVILLELDVFSSEHHSFLYFRWHFGVQIFAQRSKKRKICVSTDQGLF